MLLRVIPKDIVERIVILTDSYRDYKTICQLIERLKDPQRRARIIESITKREVDKEGNILYYLDGKLHRENDKPAIEWADGTKSWWYRKGQHHRENDKPAVEWAHGTKEWWYKGQLHRENGKPAVEGVDGMKEWWVNGKRIK